jgi:D-alanyl-D-alanine-carboxypeptidase/D-alanyl-D-alanine-endopeptidase
MSEHPSLESALKTWLDDRPGGVSAALVSEKGSLFGSAGKFAADDPRPITADTEFEIGSVTKVFTGLLLADAIRVGKLRVDVAVAGPFAETNITHEQLATHTSGLPRLHSGFAARERDNPYAEQYLSTLVSAWVRDVPNAKPGTVAYSNFGFAVLGQAIAAAWGRSYEELLRDRIFTPLELKDTFASWRDADPIRLAPGHALAGRVKNWDGNAYAPAGAVTSTARDMATFVQACLGLVETPLAPIIEHAMRPRVAGEKATRRHGFGWITDTIESPKVVWHNGGTGGYRSIVALDPTRKIGIVVLTNHIDSVDGLGMALLSGKKLPATVHSADAAKELLPFLGKYPLNPQFVLTIAANRDQLFVQATNQPAFKLGRIGEDRFAVEGPKAEISFERDNEGNIVALVLHQNGRDSRGRKE